MRLNTAYPLFLYKNNFTDYDLNSSISNAIHLPHPLHRIGCFQLLGHTFALCHLLYKTLEHFLRLSVDVKKVAVQLAAGQQVGIAHTAMLLEIPKVPLSSYPDICLFFFRQFQARQVIIALQFVPITLPKTSLSVGAGCRSAFFSELSAASFYGRGFSPPAGCAILNPLTCASRSRL